MKKSFKQKDFIVKFICCDTFIFLIARKHSERKSVKIIHLGDRQINVTTNSDSSLISARDKTKSPDFSNSFNHKSNEKVGSVPETFHYRTKLKSGSKKRSNIPLPYINSFLGNHQFKFS